MKPSRDDARFGAMVSAGYGTYGIGIFTPTVLTAVIGAKSSGDSLAVSLHNDMLGARGSAIMEVFFVIEIIAAIFLVERVGRIKLQIIGFIGCAAGLLLSSLSFRSDTSSDILLLSSGLMVFYFSNNLGPNAITYLLAGEVFPTAVRGKGAGFAASFAKLGAVMAASLFPIFLHTIGTSMLLLLLAVTPLLGAVFTWNFASETKGLILRPLKVEPNRSILLDHDEVPSPALRSPSFILLQQLRENP